MQGRLGGLVGVSICRFSSDVSFSPVALSERIEGRRIRKERRAEGGVREDVHPRNPSANIQSVLTLIDSPTTTPFAVTVAIWNCTHVHQSHSRRAKNERTNLVQTPSITVEEHLHRILNHDSRLRLRHRPPALTLLSGRVEFLNRSSEQRLREMVSVARCEGWSGVGRSEEVDVGEESVPSCIVSRRSGMQRNDGLRFSLFDTGDEEGVPEGVEAGSLLVHDVGEVFVDLGGGKGMSIVVNRFGETAMRWCK